ncbi:MAG: hypothetical protein LUD19_03305 [Clostridia bacterium]|nr:hypothetical protein [Clostridia bacterium]
MRRYTERQEDTGVLDMHCKEIKLGDTVELFGMVGEVTFEAGAYGIGFQDPIDWDRLEEEIEPVTGYKNRPDFCYNDNFVSFWELLWNYDGEEDCCGVVEIQPQENDAQ